MSLVRKKKKTLLSKKTLTSSASSKTKSSAFAGFRKASVENKKNAKKTDMYKNQLYRIRVDVGETRKVIVLDAEPYFLHEHQYQNSKGKWGNYIRCRKEKGNCPACSSLDREGYYAMMLTVIDTKPYTNREGKTIKKHRQLMCVKSSMIPKYQRIFEKCKNNLRGAVLELSRDSDKEQSSGGSVEFIKKLTEAELATFKDLNKVVDYEKAFPWYDPAEMQQIFKTGKLAGAEDAESDEDFSSVAGLDDDDDDVAF